MEIEKKDQLHSFNILEIIDSEKCGYLNAQKHSEQSSGVNVFTGSKHWQNLYRPIFIVIFHQPGTN